MLAELTRRIEAAMLREIQARYGVELPRLNFTTPPKIELGELALPVAFELSRRVRRPPKEIALELAEAARAIAGIWRVDVAGAGYLNFHVHRGDLAVQLADSIAAGRHGRVGGAEIDGKIIVEHTNINPNKAAHIGHLRNAALGDSFVRCLRFLGCDVEVQNYLDNTGVQVADVVVGLERMEGKTLGEVESLGERFDYYCWDVYARVADFYNTQPENRVWRSRTLQAIEEGNNATAHLADHVAMRVVQAHLATMARINVTYDLLPRESEILRLHFWERAFEQLKAKGAVYFVDSGKNRGCWVMRAGPEQTEPDADASREDLEEDEKIIVRSDGTVTYVGKDIAYQLWKFGLLGLDFHYRPYQVRGGHTVWITSAEESGIPAPPFGRARRVYNVIDNRQSYLQEIVLQGLRALGYEEEARNSIHFSYEMVALTPACCEELGFELSEQDRKRSYVEVSGRRGLGVKADDLLDALVEKALAEVRSRRELPENEAREIAVKIAVGALRYFLLRYALRTVIAFDFKEALSFDGETGPYVQYAAVRAANIRRKLREAGVEPDDAPRDAAALQDFLSAHDDVWELLYQAARLPEAARQVALSLELAQLAKYAFHLAQRFNLFYHKYHILSEPDADRRRHLVLVVDVVRRQIEKALDLLGGEVPPKM